MFHSLSSNLKSFFQKLDKAIQMTSFDSLRCFTVYEIVQNCLDYIFEFSCQKYI